MVQSIVTAHIRRMGKVIVSVCLSVHTRGWGYLPWLGPTYLGPGGTYLGRGGGYPPWPGQHRENLLYTWRAVCLLRSRRRTVLFHLIFKVYAQTFGLSHLYLHRRVFLSTISFREIKEKSVMVNIFNFYLMIYPGNNVTIKNSVICW